MGVGQGGRWGGGVGWGTQVLSSNGRFFFFLLFVFSFWGDRVGYYVAQAGLELSMLKRLALNTQSPHRSCSSRVVWLQACTIMP